MEKVVVETIYKKKIGKLDFFGLSASSTEDRVDFT